MFTSLVRVVLFLSSQPSLSRHPRLVDYMDHCEWAFARFGVRASTWLSTPDYFQQWEERYKELGNKVLEIWVLMSKNLTRCLVWKTSSNVCQVFLNLLAFQPACLSTCLQVLTPKDSAALSRSCEDAVAAEVEFMEEHKRNEKASNLNFIFVEGFVLHGVHLQNITRGRVCWIVNWNIFSQNSLTG